MAGGFLVQMTWPVRKRVVLEAAQGMACLHARRIVHCDLKPLNILVRA